MPSPRYTPPPVTPQRSPWGYSALDRRSLAGRLRVWPSCPRSRATPGWRQRLPGGRASGRFPRPVASHVTDPKVTGDGIEVETPRVPQAVCPDLGPRHGGRRRDCPPGPGRAPPKRDWDRCAGACREGRSGPRRGAVTLNRAAVADRVPDEPAASTSTSPAWWTSVGLGIKEATAVGGQTPATKGPQRASGRHRSPPGSHRSGRQQHRTDVEQAGLAAGGDLVVEVGDGCGPTPSAGTLMIGPSTLET